jgi:membrane fusion protein (multidrug efflux system)
MNIERPIVTNPVKTEAPKRFDVAEIRRVAMIGVPVVVLLVSAALYLLGGRYVSTDDAYVKADFAAVTPGISGDVVEVYVHENERVKKGQPLMRLQSDVYQIGAAAAEAQVDSARFKIESDRAQYQQKVQSLAMAETDLMFAERELKRQSSLAASQNVSVQKLDEARHAYQSAQQRIALLKQEEAEFLSKLENKPDQPVEDFATYKMAVANVAAAKYMVDRSTVYAPFDGVVSHIAKVGDYGRTGVPVCNVVVADKVWVEANFKETELTHMHPGQPVEVHVDTYPGKVFHGHVESIAQASGSEFALLPAQNSTGNWIKVVQRIPVRVAIDVADQNKEPVLRSGMSVITDVDTGHRRIARWFGAGS